MKTIFFSVILVAFINVIAVFGQSFSSVVEIVTTYSQNGNFYLKSVPFDNESPSLRGKTTVYKKGGVAPLYEFERGFDAVDDDSNNLILSSDGAVIFYAIPYGANDEKDGLKSVSIYKNGVLFKSFTESEITGCDENKERCHLVYSNYEAVVDKQKSRWGTGVYKKVLKAGTSEQERFLSDFPIFSFDDAVYLTDSKKRVHTFDLKTGALFRSDSLENIFGEIKSKGRFNKTTLQKFEAPAFIDFPKLQNGRDAAASLATFLGMKTVDANGTKDEQYKQYRFKINATVSHSGKIEIEELELFDDLPKEKIIEFFASNKFSSVTVPKEFEKWNIGDKYFEFRKSDDRLARQEKQREIIENRKDLEKRLVAEKIGDVYIPQNLHEAFLELDKQLPEIAKKEMLALVKRDEMIRYHHGLGMSLRNNWGLWGGSRLQKYFTVRGVKHPEDMSSVVLYFYYDWLKGNKNAALHWEAKPKSVFQK